MDELKEEVRNILTKYLPGALVELQDIPGGRLGGSIIWDDFSDQSQSERQRQLWNILRGHLNPAQQIQLTTFLTFTSQEVAEMEEVLAA
jgi:hypothetical protein